VGNLARPLSGRSCSMKRPGRLITCDTLYLESRHFDRFRRFEEITGKETAGLAADSDQCGLRLTRLPIGLIIVLIS
jgi:hypothetical protein